MATALTAALVLPGLGSSSLAQDEGSTWDASGRSFAALFDMVRRTETNGSLYNTMMTAWRGVAGDSEAMLRLPSAFLLLGAAMAICALALRLLGPRALPWVAVLVACHGRFLDHGREARTYTLVLLLFTIRALLFVEEVERPRRWTFVLWVVVGAAAVHAHLHASMLVVAELAAVVVLPAARRRWHRRITGWVAMVLLCLPLAATVLTRDDLEGLQILPFGLEIVSSVAGSIGGGTIVSAAALGIGGGFAVVSFVRDRGWMEPDAWRRTYLLAGAIGPSLLLGLLSFVQPMLIGRYVLYSAVPLLLLVVDVIIRIEPGRLRAGIGGLLVIGVASGALALHRRGDGEDWRDAVAMMLEEARPGDLAASADDYHLLAIGYYVEHADAATDGVVVPTAVFPSIPLGRFRLEDWSYGEITPPEFRCAVAGATRLWVIDGPAYFDLPRRAQLRTLATAAFGEPATMRTFDGGVADVTVRLYESPAPQPTPRTGCQVR